MNRFLSPGYGVFKDWDLEEVARAISQNKRLTEHSQEWWRRYFAGYPRVSCREIDPN